MHGRLRSGVHHRPARKGMVLLAMALCIIAMISVVGLAVDLGRMYIAKNETQNFVDSASLAAALELDGTSAGIDRARAQVAANPNRWNFNTASFPDRETVFAQESNGPWEANPANANGYRYARVTTAAAVPLLFVPASFSSGISGGAPVGFLLLGGFTSQVRSRSQAGQELETGFPEGLLPFSPLAHDTTTPHFGLEPGQRYTLRWPASPKLGKNVCPGDDIQSTIDLAEAGGGSERGYIEESSSAVIRASIEQDYQTVFRGIGDTVQMTGGAKQTQLTSLINRVGQDSNSDAVSYAAYVAAGAQNPNNRGNGRRVVGILINSGYPDYTVVQIGAFFLLPASEYDPGGNKPFCAEYLGAWSKGGAHKGVADSGAYVTRLVR